MEFKIVVKAIIRRDDSKILIVKRNDDDSYVPSTWETVGGGLKSGESPQAGLMREVKEEVGLEVSVSEPYNVFNFVNDLGEFTVGITFICDYIRGEVNLSPEHSAYEWIDSRNIKAYKTGALICNELFSYSNRYSGGYEQYNLTQKAIIIRDGKCFIAEINKEPGIWDLPGGRVDKGEDNVFAFKRELKEELNIENFEKLVTYDLKTWLSRSGIPIAGTASLIRTNEKLELSNEHTQGKWITEAEIANYTYIWPAMAEIIKKGFYFNKLMS